LIASRYSRTTEGISWILGLNIFGWTMDSRSIVGGYAYLLQILGAITFLMFLTLSKRNKTQYLADGNPRHLKAIVWSVFGIAFVQLLVSTALGQSPEGAVRFVLLLISVTFALSLKPNMAKELLEPSLWFGSAIALSIPLSALANASVQSTTEVGELRFGGIIGHPNYAAYVAAATCLLWFVRPDLRYSKANFWVLLLCTLMTQTRTAIIAVVVGLLIISLKRFGKFLKMMSAVSIFVLIALLSGFAGGLLERFTFIERSGGLAGENSSGWRLLQWQTVWEYLNAEGWAPVGWNKSGGYLLSGLPPHNFILQGSMELGILGLFVSLWIISGMVLVLWKTKQLRILIPTLILGSIFDAGLWVPSFAYFLVLVPLLFAKASLGGFGDKPIRRLDQKSSRLLPN
jgi:O-antigen ligase